jgi:hypothetical protein
MGKSSTFRISVDEDINVPKWEVIVDSLRKDIYLVEEK